MRQINRLNEEISRWAFEIRTKNSPDWFIAFTNPTAGPWKTIKAQSLKTQEIGEVYRFALEEDRPDIIMYNDNLKCAIIFEAKDSLNKLTEQEQVKKSVDVVKKLAKKMRIEITNDFWSGRNNYNILLGLLWGSTDESESSSTKELLFDQYHNGVISDKNVFVDAIVGVETLYKNNDLKCELFYKCYSKGCEKLLLDLKNSFKL